MSLIETVKRPNDLKKLSIAQLYEYAKEVRELIKTTVTANGGHLASNLGVVELTIALHYVFDAPSDKIIFDVGHQSYTHKIITERAEKFHTLRTSGGISGFMRPDESEYDPAITGHSSTSLSLGLGYARARDLLGDDYNVISVIGDGSFTGGMAFEAINDIGASKTPMIIVLNDNKMSISPNVGALSQYFGKLRISKRYSTVKFTIKRGAAALPLIGDKLVRFLEKSKSAVKSLFSSTKLFETYGIKYIGPFDGHDIANMVSVFRQVKKLKKPVIVHLLTIKGEGDLRAIKDPAKFHGVAPAYSIEKTDEHSFANVVSDFLIKASTKNDKIVAITAAMKEGTGLSEFADKFPNRYFDVGIAEQHAVTLASGMASGGIKPYFAVYSTFLQRAYDQLYHDVALANSNVTFLIDRAGAVGSDGVTHQGLYDLSYLTSLPNITVFAPKDGTELAEVLDFSLTFDRPLAIRYPKSYDYELPCKKIEYGKAEQIKSSNSQVHVLAVGGRTLSLCKNLDVNLYNVRFVKPFDTELINKCNKSKNLIITLEDNVLNGGFGSSVNSYLNEVGKKAELVTLGFLDKPEDSFSVSESYQRAGLTEQNIKNIIAKFNSKS